jgi:hypothetical protein
MFACALLLRTESYLIQPRLPIKIENFHSVHTFVSFFDGIKNI